MGLVSGAGAGGPPEVDDIILLLGRCMVAKASGQPVHDDDELRHVKLRIACGAPAAAVLAPEEPACAFMAGLPGILGASERHVVITDSVERFEVLGASGLRQALVMDAGAVTDCRDGSHVADMSSVLVSFSDGAISRMHDVAVRSELAASAFSEDRLPYGIGPKDVERRVAAVTFGCQTLVVAGKREMDGLVAYSRMAAQMTMSERRKVAGRVLDKAQKMEEARRLWLRFGKGVGEGDLLSAYADLDELLDAATPEVEEAVVRLYKGEPFEDIVADMEGGR